MLGQTVGKYRISSRLGRGGMGTVYKAIDETLGRDVAIKILNPDLADSEVLRRFRAEAVTLARLNHPNIATIYELAEHNGELLMVMEFVRGETLDKISDRAGPMPFGRAAHLCSQVLDALGHAHRAGIVHRDLKPANLMLAESGIVKVMDFGIARMIGTEHLTSDGYMIGTPAYMAPEQVMGVEVDGRADLYSIGVVLYRLLTANLPFIADTAIAMAQKQIKDPPTPLRQFRAELPPICGEILERALAKAPVDRYQTAEEFRGVLNQVASASARVDTLEPLSGSSPRSPQEGDVELTATATPAAGFRTADAIRAAVPAFAGTGGAPAAAASPFDAGIGVAPGSVRAQPSARSVKPVHRAWLPALVVVGLALAIGLAFMVRRFTNVLVPAPPPPAVASNRSPDLSVPLPDDASPGLPGTTPEAVAAASRRDPSSAPGGTSTSAKRATAERAGAPDTGTASSVAAPPPPVAASDALPPVTNTLAPVVFPSVTLLVFDGNKSRELSGSLHIGERDVSVMEGNQSIRTAALGDIIGIFQSHSREPRWILSNGVVLPVGKVDAGILPFLKRDRDWVTVRTRAGFLPIRTDASIVPNVIAALEARTGLKSLRAESKN